MHANVNAPPTLGANIPPMPTFTAPAFTYGYPTNRYDDFILIVVLFILLIIVGACGFNFYK
ncbi:YjcZ family sporulation protein [Calidifontibacillus oryziterrae]|uniref:YjcZ family sporulation protein n=1 Tax=Calidifontibacillus oryziterrae TaxID=1191699 RepID=UPI0002F982A4|nr:YjcZ family sporulation protein [Calidifontibacillus oryziterrae]